MRSELETERLYGTKPSLVNGTNVWVKGKGLDDIRESVTLRGNDPKLFYNCYCRINGVEDKLTYSNELYQFWQELKNAKRQIVIVNGEIPKPSPDELSRIRWNHYERREQMIMDLSANIQYTANIELQRLMKKAFVDVLLMETDQEKGNVNKLTNQAVYLLCFLKRYQPLLFSNWKQPDISCFIYLGGCKNETEAMFVKFLARLPVDVLILCPNLNGKCRLEDKLLYEVNYSESLALDRFPEENSQVRIGTAAFHAERTGYIDVSGFRNVQEPAVRKSKCDQFTDHV